MDDHQPPDSSTDSKNHQLPSSGAANGGRVANINGFHAIQRGLSTLAETQADENLSEIRKLDTQIDHLSDYLEKVERRNSELNSRLQNVLEEQRKERMKRRASLHQRQQESLEEQAEFNTKIQALLTRCQQARHRCAQTE